MNLEYSEAVGEVLQLLKYTEKALIDKIPKKLLEFFERNAVLKSDFNIDINKPIEQINLKQKSKALIGMIYRNYWCDMEERKAYDEILWKNEERFQEEARKKYNPDDIFKPRETANTIEETAQEEVNIVPYKESILKKIIQKIKSLLHK